MGEETLNPRDAYRVMLRDYPDVLNIDQMCEILSVSTKTGYALLKKGSIQHLKVGRSYRIPKAHLLTYLAIQSCEDGWDYTIYHSDFSVMDGGQLDEPELTIQEVREEILEAHHMEKGRRVLKDYDLIMDKVADAEELGLSNRPSTLEKLAELAGAREKCDAPECNPFGCKKARVAHEL